MRNPSRKIWLAATVAAGRIVFRPAAHPAAGQPGTFREQLQVASLAAENPWGFVDSRDAFRAARRTILHHARRESK